MDLSGVRGEEPPEAREILKKISPKIKGNQQNFEKLKYFIKMSEFFSINYFKIFNVLNFYGMTLLIPRSLLYTLLRTC